MHSVAESDRQPPAPTPAQVLCHAVTLIVEGRMPKWILEDVPDFEPKVKVNRFYEEGPHCPNIIAGVPQPRNHRCVEKCLLCNRYLNLRNALPQVAPNGEVVVEVFLASQPSPVLSTLTLVTIPPSDGDILLESHHLKLERKKSPRDGVMPLSMLFNILRSALHFSQLSSWLSSYEGKLPATVVYRMCSPADASELTEGLIPCHSTPPVAEIDSTTYFTMCCKALQRLDSIPKPIRTGSESSKPRFMKLQGVKKKADCDQSDWKMGQMLESQEPPCFDGLLPESIATSSAVQPKPCGSRCRTESETTVVVNVMETPNVEDVIKKLKDENTKVDDVKKIKEDAKKIQGLNEPKSLEQCLPVVDDRMKITCDMPGKHHCHSELDEDPEPLQDTEERPKRRRSVSFVRPQQSSRELPDVKDVVERNPPETHLILHGKFKDHHQENYQHMEEGVSTEKFRILSSQDKNGSGSEKAPFETSNPFLAAILRTMKAKSAVEDENEEEPKTKSVSVNTDISFSSYPSSAVFVLQESSLRPQHSSEGKRVSVRKISFNSLEPVHFPPAFAKRVDDLKNTTPTLKDEGQQYVECTGERPLVPSARDQLRFRRSLESATQLIFHRNQGLPLLYSSAPHRTLPPSGLLNSGSYEDEVEQESPRVPISPGAATACAGFLKSRPLSPLPMLGSFEESVLHGRLEPVSTVHGFTAELGANGVFIPPHLHLPVTVFFYSLCENEKVSSPYLGHINLVKKGYNVPRQGTIQVTLFNPLKTVVKMFVVPYDLNDMPPNSCTFLRQRTLYMPSGSQEDCRSPRFDFWDPGHKYSRYLIHLRFCSSKGGKIYLHTDIRMVIFRKTDADTAMELRGGGVAESYELRAQTYGPNNPKYSLK